MKYKTFSVRIPADLCDSADTEALMEGLSRNYIIIKALKERYRAHAPPVVPTQSKSRALPRVRKQKQKAEAN